MQNYFREFAAKHINMNNRTDKPKWFEDDSTRPERRKANYHRPGSNYQIMAATPAAATTNTTSANTVDNLRTVSNLHTLNTPGQPGIPPGMPRVARIADRLHRPYFDNQARIRERRSMGIACCRFNNGRPEILLICKRFTYSFNMFVHGRYNSEDNSALITLLSGMTVDEKHDLLSLNFVLIWYRVWLNSPQKTFNYLTAKNKFENTFVADNGARLRKLIAKSHHSDKIWEIPKGRKKNKLEPDINCAIREFQEETGIARKNYKIFPSATRTYSHVDSGTRYINTYFIAFMRNHIEPKINFALQDQVDEIGDIRWMNLEDIKYVDTAKRLTNFVKPIFNYVKNHTK